MIDAIMPMPARARMTSTRRQPQQQQQQQRAFSKCLRQHRVTRTKKASRRRGGRGRTGRHQLIDRGA